jgi:hypothetical protein
MNVIYIKGHDDEVESIQNQFREICFGDHVEILEHIDVLIILEIVLDHLGVHAISE